MPQKDKRNGFGIAAFVLSILGVLCVGFFPPFSILSLIFSLIQRKKYSNGLNTAALVLSIVGLALSLLMIIFIIFGIAFLTAYTGLEGETWESSMAELEDPSINLAAYYADATTDSMRISLSSDYGYPSLTSLAYYESDSSRVCKSDGRFIIDPGMQEQFTLSGANCAFEPGEYFRGDIAVTYNVAEKGLREAQFAIEGTAQ